MSQRSIKKERHFARPGRYFLFRKEILSTISPKRGNNLLETPQTSVLSTGCYGIDELLQGGLHPGEITEISGETATGKTQLAFSTTLTTLCANKDNKVLFIDTVSTFSAERMRMLFLESDRFEEEDVMNRIRIVKCFNVYSVMEFIEDLRDHLENKDKNDNIYTNIKLIIIDSFAAILAPLLGVTQTQGHSLMVTFTRILRNLAKEYDIAILVINAAIASYPNNPISVFSSTKSKPSLGISWTFMPNIQLYLTHCIDYTIENGIVIKENEGEKNIQQNYVYTNRKGIEVIMKPRICEVLRSRNGQMGKWCIFYMGGNELFTHYDIS
ncbi:P-loop containing nucleoside triphosphate hydrolase protein [Glomus cerebriforme]|uniref:P-loop containing nucleoside triphosphate hydrolase protein n=1 Tax=Glomus cerebriforme TaxID=658196 RepID=A0A397TKZ1_9GLOM|nr:P-loop containing nucleoside triphosphate hydrolase protein [Glomus cerebriforme]